MTHPEFDNRSAPEKPGSAISDDRFYYRNDGEEIVNVVRNAAPCRVFTGLRRFGKTSFLRRIERHCNGYNAETVPNAFEPERGRFPMDPPDGGGTSKLKIGPKAYFVEMMSSVDSIRQIRFGLKDEDERITTKIFLLDDVQGLSLLCQAEDGEALGNMNDALEEMFTRAAESKGQAVRIVMCEPTNHLEWLKQTTGIGRTRSYAADQTQTYGRDNRHSKQAAKLLLEAAGEALAPSSVVGTIEPLSDMQAWALLSGRPPEQRENKGWRFDIKDSVAFDIGRRLGGNPWLLAYAHQVIARSPSGTSILRNIGQFISMVHKAMEEGDGPKGLISIYDTLSNDERLIVQLLHSAGAGHPEAKELFSNPSNMLGKWKPESGAAHQSLTGLGVCQDENGWATKLKLEGLDAPIRASLSKSSGRGIYDSPSDIDQRLWSQMLRSPHPKELLATRTVIHQFSDLLFRDDKNDDYWSKYIHWLADDVPHDERPHFIVVCGNVLAGSPEREDAEAYRGALGRAFTRLAAVGKYMRLAGSVERSGDAEGMTSNSTNSSDRPPERPQFILVPGVLDGFWSSEILSRKRQDGSPAALEIWDEEVARFGFSCMRTTDGNVALLEPKVFAAQRVMFVPFDTLSLEATKQALNDNAARDVCAIRRRIRGQFYKELSRLQKHKVDEKGGVGSVRQNWNADDAVQTARSFLNYTSRYVVNIDDSVEFKDDEDIDDPTFKWVERARQSKAASKGTKGRKGAASKSAEQFETNWASEAGFISIAESTATFESVDRKRQRNPDPMVVFAITHHCPQTRRRAALVEFFQAYEFREALAKGSVKWVLHGHVARAHHITLSDWRPRTDRERPDEWITHLVGAASFSSLSELLPSESVTDGEPPSQPSFIRIEVAPHVRTDDVQEGRAQDPAVTVSLGQWPPQSDRPTFVKFK